MNLKESSATWNPGGKHPFATKRIFSQRALGRSTSAPAKALIGLRQVLRRWRLGTAATLLSAAIANAGIQVVVDHNDNDHATADFKFQRVVGPSRGDAGAQAVFTLVDGRQDNNSGGLDKLHDGLLPGEEDEPSENFFFNAGTDGGRLLVDLGKVLALQRVSTYSWHASDRAPQVYWLYGSDGKAGGFNAQPKRGTDPATCGWQLIARVDTRPKTGAPGGQYGVSISATDGLLGQYGYLLFDLFRTENTDRFGNTFYSEIDLIDRDAPVLVETPVARTGRDTVVSEDGRYQIVLDTSATPDLTEWARQELAPVVRTWYPKLVKMLPSEGFEAPQRITIVFSPTMRGVAATSGARIRCAATWIRQNLKGEAKGSIVHELVHVVQSYGRARRSNPSARPAPGWLVEGIADYIRWFLFEPETQGAEVTKNNLERARYDASYRVSANFLNWVVQNHDPDFIATLNAALREGKYSEDLWKERTGRTAPELGAEWKKSLEKKLLTPDHGASLSPPPMAGGPR